MTASCSSALRPFLIAALLAHTQQRPTVVVAPDDRAAGELAGDLAAWLAPRSVRFYPSRGVTYESHLAPPPHLVGLRIAALDALAAADAGPADPAGPPRATGSPAAPGPRTPVSGAPVLVASAPALSEKVPDPALRPRSIELAVGELVDLDELAQTLVEMGYERVPRSRIAASSRCAAACSICSPRRRGRAVRVEMFDIEIESLRTFSTFTHARSTRSARSRWRRPGNWRSSTAGSRLRPPASGRRR